jgi:hypothetical protein
MKFTEIQDYTAVELFCGCNPFYWQCFLDATREISIFANIARRIGKNI